MYTDYRDDRTLPRAKARKFQFAKEADIGGAVALTSGLEGGSTYACIM